MSLFSFDPRRSYLNGYYAANFVLPTSAPVGPRLGRYGRFGFDARRRYLSGMGDDPTMYDPGNTLIPPSVGDPSMYDPGNTLTPPVYTPPSVPLILVPSSAGDPSMYNPTTPLTPPPGYSSGSPASAVAAASASAAAAASALAARNRAAIVNPQALQPSLLTQQSIAGVPNSYLFVGIGGILLLSMLSGGKKRR